MMMTHKMTQTILKNKVWRIRELSRRLFKIRIVLKELVYYNRKVRLNRKI
jgi:hypothetical protein